MSSAPSCCIGLTCAKAACIDSWWTSPCSARELERGDREVWDAVGDHQIGIVHSAAMPVKYGYDKVLDKAANNKQARKQIHVLPAAAVLRITSCMTGHHTYVSQSEL